MQPTSPAINSNRRQLKRADAGFTLVEIMVVVVILLIMASLIIPRVVAAQQGRARLDLEASIARLPLEAKSQAARSQEVCDLRISGTTLILEQQPAPLLDGVVATGGVATQIKTLDLGATLQISSVQLNGKVSDAGTWQWNAYPDGSTDRGAIEFTEDDQTKSLIMSGTGDPTWSDGTAPDVSLDHWNAGSLEQRSTDTSTTSGS